MKKLVHADDTSDHGGYMLSATGGFFSNGKRVCVDGDMHHCPRDGHGDTPVTGSGSVTSDGKKLVRVGDRARCGAIIQTGGTVNVG